MTLESLLKGYWGAALILGPLMATGAGFDGNGAVIGVLATSRQAVVGNVVAPAGTTVFSGDTVSALESPVLIMLSSWSRVELIKATARFLREGDGLAIETQSGLIRFNFQEGKKVTLRGAGHEFKSLAGRSARVGSLVVNVNGQVAMSLCDGQFSVIPPRGPGVEVNSRKPLVVLEQAGSGELKQGSDSLTDPGKLWTADELEGRLVDVGGEVHEILANESNTLWIDGRWKSPTGKHSYAIRYASKVPVPALISSIIPTAATMITCMPVSTVSMIAPAAAAATAGSWITLEAVGQSDESRNPQ